MWYRDIIRKINKSTHEDDDGFILNFQFYAQCASQPHKRRRYGFSSTPINHTICTYYIYIYVIHKLNPNCVACIFSNKHTIPVGMFLCLVCMHFGLPACNQLPCYSVQRDLLYIVYIFFFTFFLHLLSVHSSKWFFFLFYVVCAYCLAEIPRCYVTLRRYCISVERCDAAGIVTMKLTVVDDSGRWWKMIAERFRAIIRCWIWTPNWFDYYQGNVSQIVIHQSRTVT